ncbi:MAG: hypothetical protein LBU70_02370 [Chitinispirillales bacterium]|jgi:hypothetical protein|nr:hypothetical protein [Chitinispirillales bacterium]
MIIAIIAVSIKAEDTIIVSESTADTSVQAISISDIPAPRKNKRAVIFDASACDDSYKCESFDPTRVSEYDVFHSDASGPSEILRYRMLTSVSIPYSLSSNLNRVLPYGNTAPNPNFFLYAATSVSTPPFILHGAARHWAGDMISPMQARGFEIDPHGYRYATYPHELTSPELAIFWENGVFNQNTLNLRLNRALSPNIMMSLFSNYRYFANTRFNHERNDVANFYRNFYSDTSKVMNHGYNPLVDEHVLGGSILRTSAADSSKLYASFVYMNLLNEYALNYPPLTLTPTLDRLNWALLGRRIYKIDAALTGKKMGAAQLNLKTALVSEAIESSFPPDTTIATGSEQAYNFIIDATLAMPSNLEFTVGTMIRNIEFFDEREITRHDYHSEISYSRDFNFFGIPNFFDAYVGATASPDSDSNTIYISTRAGVSVDFLLWGSQRWLKLYANTEAAGVEGRLESSYWGALLGYQNHHKEYSDWAVRNAWLGGIPPYQQPTHTVIISPWIHRIGGFSLLSKTFITDTKPHLKTSANLSYLITPKGMRHTFETALGFDYWSERDPVWFAGFHGWNDPIFDVNVKITAHISTFRLFYKIDNILNRRQAYVPGYFSPGVTFRWGINWVLL